MLPCCVGYLKRNNKMMNKEQNIFPFIERLLDGAEVEWKKLGEVLKRTKGTKITAKQMRTMHKSGAPVKIFAGGKTFAFVDFDDIPEKDINRNPSVIVKSRGIIEFEYYDKPFTHKNEMWSYYSDNKSINIKYVYYYLKHQESFFQKIGSKMQMPQISLPDTEKFKIPIPPFAVQEEIVRILDKFTTLEAELEAELDCRKRLYEYYRNQLLSFNMLNRGGQRLNNVNIESLEEVVEIKRGRRLVRKELSGTGHYAVFQNSMTPLGYFDNSNVDGDSTFIISAGAAGEIGYSSVDFWAADDIYYFIPSAMVCSKYLYYFLLTKQSAIKGQVRRASVPRLAKSAFAKIQIPIPSLAEQHRIVSILDKFDTLVNSISEGLPKEIELRRKQYEYYRNQLLSFPEHKVSA